MASERCPGCGGWLAEGLTLCTPCKASQRAEADRAKDAFDSAAKARQEALERTNGAFPEVIRETALDTLPAKMQETARGYQPGAKESWVLFGPTRSGKTRTAFLMALAYAKHHAKPATFLTMRGFEATIEKSFRDKRHAETVERLIGCPFLVLDDFGKEKLTERLAVDLFAIIDERTADRRPTIITTNLTGDLLEARFATVDPSMAEPMVARLREFFRKAQG
jgi:DNA replication protein DnaC